MKKPIANRIESEIDYYIDCKESTGCLLITGQWGSGKTFLLDNYEKKNKDKYAIARISLFGISDVIQLHKAVKESYISLASGKIGSLIRNVKKKAGKALDESADTLSSITTGAANTALQGARSILTIDFMDFFDVESSIKKAKKSFPFVIVFDDFERCKIPMAERMGAINGYIENNGIKTIILADEDRIKGKKKYREFKEKVVSRTIRLTSVPDEVITSIIESSELRTTDYRQFVNHHKGEFVSSFKDSGYMNYRTLKCCICDFERVYDAWIKAGTRIDQVQTFIYEFCAKEYEAKAGKYVKASDCDSFILNDYEGENDNEKHSKTKEKYRDGAFSWDFYSVSKWIVAGEWDAERFEEELLQKYAFVETPKNKLLHTDFWSLEQSDIEEGLPITLRDAYKGELSRNDLIFLLAIIHELKTYEIELPCQADYGRIHRGLEKRIQMIKAGKITEPESHRFVYNNQVDAEAIPILRQINRMENRLLAWKYRNMFISYCRGEKEISRNDIRNQYFEEFDTEMLETFVTGYKNADNHGRFELTRALLSCVFDFSECSDIENIKTTILHFSKLIEELVSEIENKKGEMGYIVINETIESCSKRKNELEQSLEKEVQFQDGIKDMFFE